MNSFNNKWTRKRGVLEENKIMNVLKNEIKFALNKNTFDYFYDRLSFYDF